MSRILFLILCVCFSTWSYGQHDSTSINIKIICSPQNPEVMTWVLKMDDTAIRLDSLAIRSLKPDWIEKIKVLKDEEGKRRYGSKENVVIIYPKKKKRNKFRKLIKKP